MLKPILLAISDVKTGSAGDNIRISLLRSRYVGAFLPNSVGEYNAHTVYTQTVLNKLEYRK